MTVEDFKTRIGAVLRDRRHDQGLTLWDVSHRSEVSKSFVSQVERGETIPSVPTLYRIASALNLSLIALFIAVDAKPHKDAK